MAIAQIPDDANVTSWQGDDTDGFDTPSGTLAPAPGMRVKKFGRTTGLTHDRIQSRIIRTPVKYESDSLEGIVWFKDVWAVRSIDSDPFAVGGDSGSLVVTEDGEHAVGIVFAANNRGGYVNIIPIDLVLSAFGGITFVNDHGI